MEKVYVAIIQYQKNNKQMLKESYVVESSGKGFYGKEQERVKSPAPRINKINRIKIVMTAIKDAIVWSKKMGLQDVEFLTHDKEVFDLIDQNVYFQRESKEVNALIFFISNLLKEENYRLSLIKSVPAVKDGDKVVVPAIKAKSLNQAFDYAKKRTADAKMWQQIEWWNHLREVKNEGNWVKISEDDGTQSAEPAETVSFFDTLDDF
ncbi:hypothetical protein [Enterococcus sp. AD013-P3]|uniref:hypothetical protein n=1 Tax=Enterococcus sp. AD013-P3 TaxID=3411036 RepID=UPI003B93A6D9